MGADPTELATIRLIQKEHEKTRRQFIFLMMGMTMVTGVLHPRDAAMTIAEMAMFPVEELPEDPITLYQWARDWVDYNDRSRRPISERGLEQEPPDWYQEGWISKGW